MLVFNLFFFQGVCGGHTHTLEIFEHVRLECSDAPTIETQQSQVPSDSNESSPVQRLGTGAESVHSFQIAKRQKCKNRECRSDLHHPATA